MRVGLNPHKDLAIKDADYHHQIIIPVYIPHNDGYFKDSFRVFKCCLNSVFNTTHSKTFITVVNNGSSAEVKEYLNNLFEKSQIHEVIHTHNIGKLNAILKGLAGNNFELVTVTDADVLFLSGWQSETNAIFQKVPKAGVVGLSPQIKMYKAHCGNVIFDNLFSKDLRFVPLSNPEAMKKFYSSIGWNNDYNSDYLKYILAIEKRGQKALVGSGHFVATYKKDIFDEITSYLGYKLGGDSEDYLDRMQLKKDYWRLTTFENFAYHMGNVYEDWMSQVVFHEPSQEIPDNFAKRRPISKAAFFLKNTVLPKIMSFNIISVIFYRWKKLPKTVAKNFNQWKQY
jgi:glycosyl transferase family 2